MKPCNAQLALVSPGCTRPLIIIVVLGFKQLKSEIVSMGIGTPDRLAPQCST